MAVFVAEATRCDTTSSVMARERSLRTLLMGVLVALGTLALLAAGSLVVLTSVIADASDRMGEAVESVTWR